jgi:hypothetical protein
MVGADVHPAGIGGQVADAARDRLVLRGVSEVVGADPGRLTLPAIPGRRS